MQLALLAIKHEEAAVEEDGALLEEPGANDVCAIAEQLCGRQALVPHRVIGHKLVKQVAVFKDMSIRHLWQEPRG